MTKHNIPITTAIQLVAIGVILTVGIPYIWHLWVN